MKNNQNNIKFFYKLFQIKLKLKIFYHKNYIK